MRAVLSVTPPCYSSHKRPQTTTSCQQSPKRPSAQYLKQLGPPTCTWSYEQLGPGIISRLRRETTLGPIVAPSYPASRRTSRSTCGMKTPHKHVHGHAHKYTGVKFWSYARTVVCRLAALRVTARMQLGAVVVAEWGSGHYNGQPSLPARDTEELDSPLKLTEPPEPGRLRVYVVTLPRRCRPRPGCAGDTDGSSEPGDGFAAPGSPSRSAGGFVAAPGSSPVGGLTSRWCESGSES